jgi:hypothetical protein
MTAKRPELSGSLVGAVCFRWLRASETERVFLQLQHPMNFCVTASAAQDYKKKCSDSLLFLPYLQTEDVVSGAP